MYVFNFKFIIYNNKEYLFFFFGGISHYNYYCHYLQINNVPRAMARMTSGDIVLWLFKVLCLKMESDVL